jgi:hypothetical protein
VSIEREAKLTAPVDMQVPDLDGLVPGVSVVPTAGRRLDATYYDTRQLDLVRWPAWTVKLPGGHSDAELERRELNFEGPPETVPSAARDLLRAFLRRRRLVPVARLSTDRSPLEVRDATGERLAEIADDHVTVRQGEEQTGEFREIEVFAPVPGRRPTAALPPPCVRTAPRTDPSRGPA